MSKSNALETDYLGLELNATPIANLADNAAVAPLTQLFISWHTADAGEAGTEATNEGTFTGISRTPISRSNASPQWTISSPGGVGTAQNTNAVTGPTYTQGAGSPQTITHFAIGVAASGATKILRHGQLTNPIIMNPGITLTVPALGLTITED